MKKGLDVIIKIFILSFAIIRMMAISSNGCPLSLSKGSRARISSWTEDPLIEKSEKQGALADTYFTLNDQAIVSTLQFEMYVFFPWKQRE